MKKLLLSISALFVFAVAHGQIAVKGISPGAIAGNYTFSWADPAGGWGTPDFTVPNTWVEDTLMMVEDGTPGTNPQGNPISQEGCNPLTNNLTGKIAVIFRNTCEFGAKALNAQNAGAVGVIIVNRNPGEWLNMGPGANGATVTIPVVMLDFVDGMNIVQEMANGPVVMFMGNKIGLNPNDAGMAASSTLIPKNGGVVSYLAQNGAEFGFDLGTRIYNYGNQSQAGITLTATVTNPSGAVVYNNSVSGINLAPGDSIDIEPSQAMNLPAFSLATYPMGRYTLAYNISLGGGVADDDSSDNSASYDFVIQDSLYSFAALDVATVIPLLRASKWVIGPILARKELQATTKKQVGKEIQKGATRQTGKEIGTRNVSKGSAFNTPSDKSSSDTAQPKKRRYSIGDMINVNYQGMTIKGVVKNVIPGGYSIGLPDGKTISIPEPIMESPTQGSTSAADVTVGAVYPNKKVKNSKNKDGTVKNALDMDANLLTGGSLVKR